MNSKQAIKSTLNFGCTLMLGMSILTSTGCLGGLGQTAANLPTEPAPSEPTDSYRIDMIGAFSKTTSLQGEIDGPITVQEVLVNSGATKKFRNMDVVIYRTVEESGRLLKLVVDYVPRTKSVKPELNYAIRPNDRIIVQSRTTTAIDKVINSISQTD
jgi:hypothetical protein